MGSAMSVKTFGPQPYRWVLAHARGRLQQRTQAARHAALPASDRQGLSRWDALILGNCAERSSTRFLNHHQTNLAALTSLPRQIAPAADALRYPESDPRAPREPLQAQTLVKLAQAARSQWSSQRVVPAKRLPRRDAYIDKR